MRNSLFQHGGQTGEYWFRIAGYGLAIKNINKGDLLSAQADIQNLITTPQISPAAIAVLQTALQSTAQTELDPNWQPQIMASPAELAGYGLIYSNEVEQAIA